jgi:hypothetical protein
MQCYRCGASLTDLSLPFGRLDECPSCSMQLHVCRMCVFFDTTVPKQCREDDANEVKAQDKERANFCDYFKPSDAAFDGSFANAEAGAKQALDALFDESPGDEGSASDGDGVTDADKLFK